MSIIIVLVFTEPKMISFKTFPFKLLEKRAIIKEPSTPTDAASVGVAQPVYILPRTSMIKRMIGNRLGSALKRSSHVYSSPLLARLGLIKLRIMIYPLNPIARIIPGMIPAINNLPILTSATIPYTIIIMLGGIKKPKVPAPARDPILNERL